MKSLLAPLLLALSLTTPFAHAHDSAAQRSITVAGEAEVRVAPDEVLLTLGVETRNKLLPEVRRANEQRMRSVLAAIKAAGVADKDIRTDYLNLQPEYEQSGSRRTFIEYVQRTTVVVTLRDVSKFEALLTSALQSGVEYIHGVDFRVSELRKYRDEARAMAVRAAREKAIALADVLGQKVGKPRNIIEGQGGSYSSYDYWGHSGQAMAQSNMFSANAGSGSGQDGPLAPGTVSVRANVSITFELE